MEIFELDESRLPQVIRLIKSIYEENRSALYFEKKPDDIYLEHMLRNKIELSLENQAIDIVAVEKGKVLGECEIICEVDIGKIGILVDLESRRHKIGTTLLEESLKRARKIGIKRVYSEVDSGNVAALRFFEKHNFKEIEERESNSGAKLKLFIRDIAQ